MNRIPSFLKWLTSSILAIAILTGVFFLRGDGQATPLSADVTAMPTAMPTATDASSDGPITGEAQTQDPATDIDNLLIALVDSEQKILNL